MKEKAKKETSLAYSDLVRFYNEMIGPKFDLMNDRFNGLEDRIGKIQCEITDIRGYLLDLYHKHETLNQEYIVIVHQLKRIESKLDRTATQEELQRLDKEVAELRQRIEAIERSRTSH